MKKYCFNWLMVMVILLLVYPIPATASPLSQDESKSQGDILLEEGIEIFYQGDVQGSLDKFESALAAYQESGDRAGEGRALNAIGVAYLGFTRFDQFETAVEYFEQSLAISQEVNDRLYQAKAMHNMGVAYRNLWQLPKAIELLEQSLIIYAEVGGPEEEHKAFYNAASVYRRMGRYEKALRYHQRALDIRKKLGHGGEVAASLNDMGTIYKNLGQSEEALRYYTESLELHHQYNIEGGQAVNLNNIGNIYYDQGNFQEALEHYQEALEINIRVSPFLDSKALYLNNIGRTYKEMEQYQEALKHHTEALDITEAISDYRGKAITLNNIGDLYRVQEHYEQALSHYQQALSIWREIGFQQGVATTLRNIGITYEQQGNMSLAIDAYQQAVEASETMLGDLSIEEFKTGFAGKQEDVYESIINILWDEGRFLEAFNYIERARARAFLDQVASGNIDFRTRADAALLNQEQELKAKITIQRSQLAALQKIPSNEQDGEAIAAIETELKTLEEDYTRLLTELKLTSPESASLISVDVASLDETQTLLDNQTTLVEYFVTDDRILAFIITRDDFHTATIDVNREKLSHTITIFRDFADRNDPYPISLQQLYQWLIEPLKSHLNTPKVGIIPHNILHYLPFATLTDDERYLNDDYVLFTLPSASVLRFIQNKRKPAAKTFLFLGNPTITGPLADLKFAQQEVETLAALYDYEALVGDAATESAVWAQASEAGIVHLAAHSTYNRHNPLFSSIHLTKDDQHDGRLEVYEIYTLDLTGKTNLVVLSACETAIGKLSAGDEVVGLNRAFLYTGTPTVISSLWNVDDEATSLLMERFYIHLKSEMGKAQALQQAQLEVREQYPYPYYWAAFVLSGYGGEVVLASEDAEPVLSLSNGEQEGASTPAASEPTPTEAAKEEATAPPAEVAAVEATPTQPEPATETGQTGGGCLGLMLPLALLGVAGLRWKITQKSGGKLTL